MEWCIHYMMTDGEEEEESEVDECVNGNISDTEISSDISLTTKQLSIFNSVSLGLYHGLAVSKDKGVFTWGSIWHNVMGLGISTGEAREPRKIPFFEDKSVLQVSCGDAHSAVLVASDSNYLGFVYTFGLGNNGRLGYPKSGQQNDNSKPNLMGESQNDESPPIADAESDREIGKKPDKKDFIRKIRLNRKASLEEVLQSDSGISEVSNQSWFSIRPFKVKLNLKVKLVSCGSAHTLVICEDSSLWSWGCGSYGVLGIGSTYDLYEPTKINLDNVTHVSAGARHSLAVSDNSLYSWGYGGNGRLGLYHSKTVSDPTLVNGKGLDKVVYVSAGQSHSACINSKGEIFTWGSGQGGRLGHSWSVNGDLNYPHKLSIENVTFQSISCGMSHTVSLSEDGDIYFWGTLTDQSNIPIFVSLGVKVICVNAGPYGIAAITVDGDVASWGIGGYYRLGHQNVTDYKIPTFINTLRGSVGLFRVKKKETGQSNESTSYIVDVESGESHVCVLCNDKTVYAWGRALGTGATENFGSLNNPEKLIFKSKIDMISCGRNHSLALDSHGNVFAWGSNKYGQLGLGDLSYRIEPSRVDNLEGVLSVKASIDASGVIIASSDELKALRVGNLMVFGSANGYKLGLGREISSGVIMSPMSVECEEPVFRVEIGENHSMVVSLSGRLYVSGTYSGNIYHNFTQVPIHNEQGQLEAIYQAIPGPRHSAILATSGYLYLCGKNNTVCSLNDVITPVKIEMPNKQPIKYIHVCDDITLAITIDGKSWRWGSYGKDIIYSPEEIKPVRDISMDKIVGTFNFGIGLSTLKVVYSWGSNDYGQLGRGFDGKFDSQAKMVQVIQNEPINNLDAIDKEHKLEVMLIQIMASDTIDWKQIFNIVKYEPFRQREVFLYSTEQSIIKKLQHTLVIFLNENNKIINILKKKRNEMVASNRGCKGGVMEGVQELLRILYLQPAYLSKLIFMDCDLVLKVISILYGNVQDDYTKSLLMALYRMVVFAEVKSDSLIPNSVLFMKMVNKTDFSYKMPAEAKISDLINLVQSYPISPFVEQMLYFTLLLFKRHFLSLEIANVTLSQALFALILESVEGNRPPLLDFKKKLIYDVLINRINLIEEQNRRLGHNLQYQLTNELFKMHFKPGDVYVKMPCSLIQGLYRIAFNNLNLLNLSLHDPLVSIISKGLKHPNPCAETQHVFIDRRFISNEKNLSFCTYSNVPVPQGLAYRQTSYIDMPIGKEMQQIYDLEDVKTPIETFVPHRMLSPIFRYQQPNRFDAKWLLQQTLRIIKRFDTDDLIVNIKNNLEECVYNREFFKASVLEETLNLISDGDAKNMANLAVGLLEMQQKRSIHYRYLSQVLESHKNLIKEISYFDDRVAKEVAMLKKYLDKTSQIAPSKTHKWGFKK